MSTQEKNDTITMKLGRIGVVREQQDSFKESLFCNAYKEAGMLTAMIGKEQYNAKKEEHAIYEQSDNIITFVGRRGTGKSSAMLSFMDALGKIKHVCDLEHITEDIEPEEQKKFPNVEFIVLDWIDASIIEKGEDVFEMLLAKMTAEILKEDKVFQNMVSQNDYQIRELHQRLGSLYKKVLKLKLRSQNLDSKEESPISALRDLGRSIDLRQEFEELIEVYLNVKSNKRSCSNNRFLVVAIDDVDMNIEYGFDILEQIQRYLKVNRLLVLLTIDYEQLLKCCENHYKKLYKDNAKKRRIAESYIAKVLPFHMRVYLPSLKKKDYYRKRETRVEINNRYYTIKEAIFQMIWERTWIRYDSQGKKRHFMEFKNLRDLNNYFLFLQGMNKIEGELDPGKKDVTEKIIQQMEKNQRRIMDDLLFRFAEEYLPEAEKEYFISLSEEDIRRRGEIVIANFLRDVGKVSYQELRYTVFTDKYGSGQIHGFVEEMDAFGYSFGQFIRCLYFMGREVIYDKKLVHALLAMYTSTMTRIFYLYRQEVLIQKKNGSNYNMLKTLLGSSAGGSWSLYIMPKVMISSEDERFSGAIVKVDLAKMEAAFLTDIKLIEKIKKIENKKVKEQIKKDILSLMLQMQPEMIFCLFFSDFSNPKAGYILHKQDKIAIDYKIKFDISSSPESSDDRDPLESRKEEYITLLNTNSVQFNILNLINNIFAFRDCVKNFVMLLLSFSQYYWQGNNSSEEKEKVAEEIVEKLQKEKGLYESMLKWNYDCGGAVIPFYSVEIYYNMLKRLAREERQNPSNSIMKDELFLNLTKLLDKILKHLRLSDQFYNIEENKNESFVKIFDTCPIIEYLKKQKNTGKKERFEELYNTFVYEMISKDTVGKQLQEMNDKMNFFID